MPIFKFKAIDQEKKSISGLVEAANADMATGILQEKGYFVTGIRQKSSGRESGLLAFFNKVKPKDLVIFSRQFSVLISANVTMVQALNILVEQTENLKLKMVVSSIAKDVDGGEKLSSALEKWPAYFSDFYTNVIKSGETSGKLDEVLNYLADEMEKDYDMTSKIKGAMIYPAFVMGGLIVVGVIMMVWVLPKITDMMAESGGELPMATKIIIAISNALRNQWYIFIGAIAALVFGIKQFAAKPQGKKILNILILKVPIFGHLFQRIYLVRFSRSMYTLLVGGVTIVESLKIAAEVVSNEVYKGIINETIKEVEDGNPLSAAFIRSPYIPKMVGQMLNVGEKTGRLDVILTRISEFYGREIDNIVANLMTLMEPIIMVVMGVGVGIMVAAVIMPMYNMATNM